jgi:hypothetical protein
MIIDQTISDTGVRKSSADISLLFCTCGVRTTQMCTSYAQCTVRLCQLHSQTSEPSFLRPPRTRPRAAGGWAPHRTAPAPPSTLQPRAFTVVRAKAASRGGNKTPAYCPSYSVRRGFLSHGDLLTGVRRSVGADETCLRGRRPCLRGLERSPRASAVGAPDPALARGHGACVTCSSLPAQLDAWAH